MPIIHLPSCTNLTNPAPAGSPFVSELSERRAVGFTGGGGGNRLNHRDYHHGGDSHRHSPHYQHHHYPNSSTTSNSELSWERQQHAATKSLLTTSQYSSSMRNDRSRVVTSTTEYRGEKRVPMSYFFCHYSYHHPLQVSFFDM